MKTKTMPASYVPADDGAGFEAIVSVFDNKDYIGDIVRRGAFTKSINAWKASGDPVPVLWSHRMDDPHYNIGAVDDIDELAPGDPRIPEHANDWVKEHGGLWVKASLDDFGHAAQVRHLLKTRRVKQFSFQYEVMREQQTKAGNELLDLWLVEVGPTPLGMNPLTELVGAKNADPPPDEPPATTTSEPRDPRGFFTRFGLLAAATLQTACGHEETGTNDA